jgi:VCBS repeat-containing protein
MSAHLLLTLLVLLLAGPRAASQTVCAAGQYRSGTSCLACPAGTTSYRGAIGAGACVPPSWVQGPTDSYLSASFELPDALAGFSALNPTPPNPPALVPDRYGRPSSALAISPTLGGYRFSDTSILSLGGGEYSIAVWFKYATFASGGTGFPAINFGQCYDLRQMHIMSAGSGNAEFGYQNSWWDTGVKVMDNAWHFGTLVMKSSGSGLLEIYVDGVLAKSVVSAPRTSASFFHLGSHCSGYQICSGCTTLGVVDDLRIYARAITPAEVQALFLPILPTYSFADLSPAIALGVTSYTYRCKAGFEGAPVTVTQSTVDRSWTWSADTVRCTPFSVCLPGFTCPGTPTTICAFQSNCTSCGPANYSFGGGGLCGTCPPNQAVRSTLDGCIPVSSPLDVAWSFSGSAGEGLAAYSRAGPSSPSFVPDPFSIAQGALLLPSGSNISARSVPSLPTGNQARSVVARVAVPYANGAGCVMPLLGVGSVAGTGETFNVGVTGAAVGSSPKLMAYTTTGPDRAPARVFGSGLVRLQPTSIVDIDNRALYGQGDCNCYPVSLLINHASCDTCYWNPREGNPVRFIITLSSSQMVQSVKISAMNDGTHSPNNIAVYDANGGTLLGSSSSSTGNGIAGQIMLTAPLAPHSPRSSYFIVANPTTRYQVVLYRIELFATLMYSCAATNPTLPLVWYSLALTYDGANTRSYVNGALVDTLTPSAPYATPATSSFLALGGSAAGLDMALAVSDVRLYSRALTAAEVSALAAPILPTFPNVVNPPVPFTGTSFTYTCIPGFFGSPMTRTLNTTDNTWSRTGASTMNCSACGAGQYSVAGSTTTCSACPAGTFGTTTGIASSSCSGQCDAGYTCPAGSTSSRVQLCGGVGVFCPLGSGSPTAVSVNFYSTPLGVAKTMRTGQAACPANRQCTGGALLPPVDLSSTCPGGEVVVQATDEMRNIDIGPVLEASAPGWSSSPTVRFNVSSTTAAQPACPSSSYLFFATQPASNSTRLRLGGTSVSADLCGMGLSVTLRAYRFPPSTDDLLATDSFQDTCKVTIYASKSLTAPNITMCASSSGGLTVQERAAPGFAYGTVVASTLSTASAALSYRIVSSVSSPTPGVSLPFGIDCSGVLFSSRLAYSAQASSYNISIAADAVGFGETRTSFCNFTVRVTPRPLVPTLATVLLTVTDDATVGTVAGDLGPLSSNSVPGVVNYTATTTFSVLDTPDAFAVTAAGRVTVKLATLDATRKSLYAYTVSVADGLATTTYPVQIAVLPAPRAPVTYAQARSVSDSAGPGVILSPPLDATQSQGSALTFSIVDSSNTFGIFGNGTLYLLPGASALDVNLVPSYSLAFTVTAANGRAAVSTVTITVLETNKAPVFPAPATYNRTVEEGTAAGTAFDLPITATDSNRRDTLAYTITACNPVGTNGTLCPFDLDAATGRLRVAPTSAGALLADRTATFPVSPFTYSLRVTATDNGSPQRTANASVFVQVARIQPRLTSPPLLPLLLLSNASAGTSIVDMSARAWTAYSRSTLSYFLVSPQPTTAEGDVAFAVGSSTGIVSVRSPAPAWNFNTKRAFSFAVLVFDNSTGLSAQAQVDVTLLHVNRAPNVSFVPLTDVPARSRGNILSLASYVSDADVGLAGISEAFTYSLIAGNTDNTFALGSSTGQLSVLNANAPSFVFNAGTGVGTIYNLTARVCDAGINGPSLCALAHFDLRVVAGSIPPAVSDKAFVIKENSVAGTSFGAVSASDEQGYALTYSITGGNSEGLFSIVGTTGQISVSSPLPAGPGLDFETRTTYSLVVTVRNAAPTPASATATVTITVLDVNEPPTTPATSVRAVDENSAVGTAVGSALTASDIDARDQGVGRLTFTLLTTGSPFALDPVSGLLTVASAVLDYEAQGGYTLSYRVSDSAWEALRGNLTADGTVFVDINNRNDQPSLADVSARVDENGAGLSVAILRATDQDAGQGMVYTLSRTSSVCWAYSITAAQATSFSSGGGAGVAVVPVALPAVSAGALQTVVFRFRGSGSVRLVLSATATLSSSDRYEITYTRTSTEVKRIFASGSTTTVLTTAQSLLPTSTTAWAHLVVTIDRTGKRLLLGTRPSNSPSAAITTQMTLDESASTQLTIARVGVTGSVAGAVVSSVCFDSALTPSFAVDSSSGAVTTAVALDFEAQAHFGVEVMVTDSTAGNNLLPANLVDYAVVVVAVNDKNEVPVWPALVACAGAPLSTASYLACLSIPENSAINAAPTGLVPSPTDPDVGQTLVYTSQLDGNAASGARIFDINSVSRVVSLRQAGVLDFETTNGYTVRLTATDSGAPTPQLSASGDVWIAVLDVNEPPSLAAATRTVNEGDLPGTFAGLPVVGSDPDTLSVPFSTLNYTIVGGDGQALFNISRSSGQIAVAAGAVLDFELKSSYSLLVRATDGGGLFAEATITINVLNVNEKPSLFGPWTRQISEAAVAPASVGVPVNASDPDRGMQLSFAVIGGNGTGIFDVNRCSGQITLLLGASLDFEAARVYVLTIRVSDDGIPSLSDTQTYFMSVLDANDAPVLADQTRTVPENAAAGTVVGAPVTWSDPDTFASTALAWVTPTFSIVAGNDRSIFQINSTTGQLSVAAGGGALLDFEDSNANRYNLLVRVTDGGGLSAQGTAQVQVTDVNEAPFFTDATLARSIDENCPRSTRAAGDNVGTPVLANDRDAGQSPTLSFAITAGNGLGFFSIVATGASRGQIQVSATGASALDFETAPRYNLSITITDAGGLTATAVVAVSLINRNEAPVVTTSFARSVSEDAAPFSLVGGPITATDPEDSTGLRYSITAGNDAGVFRIDPTTGQIGVASTASLNFEAIPSFSLTVLVTDTGAPEGATSVLSSPTTVVISVLDVNERPFLLPATFTIAENLASSSLVGNLAPFASDPDQVDTRTFSILTQELTTSGQTPFAINASALVVATGTPLLDFERKALYTLVVEVRDKGGFTANATVQVRLRNVNEAPIWLAVPVLFARASELQDVGQALVALVRDQDLDIAATNERLAFSLLSGNTNSIFAVHPSSGQISVVNNNSLTYPVGAPAGPEYNLTVQVTDAGVDGTAISAAVLVTIRTVDNNRRPTLVPYTFFLDENAPPGTEIGRVFAADVDSISGQTVIYTLDAAGGNINRPFPFNITTLRNAGTGNVGVGILSVAWDGAAGSLPWANLDFEGPAKQAVIGGVGFSTYTTTVTATDSHPSRLSATASVVIVLRDVPESPFFAPSRVASSATFSLTVAENSPAGTPVAVIDSLSARAANSNGGLWAADDDIVDAGQNLTYAWSAGTPSALSSLFTLNTRTGAVTVSASGAANGVLDFESARRTQTLTVVVTDTTGRTDSATVSVALSDVNEVQSWNGTGIFAAEWVSASRLSGGPRVGPLHHRPEHRRPLRRRLRPRLRGQGRVHAHSRRHGRLVRGRQLHHLQGRPHRPPRHQRCGHYRRPARGRGGGRRDRRDCRPGRLSTRLHARGNDLPLQDARRCSDPPLGHQPRPHVRAPLSPGPCRDPGDARRHLRPGGHRVHRHGLLHHGQRDGHHVHVRARLRRQPRLAGRPHHLCRPRRPLLRPLRGPHGLPAPDPQERVPHHRDGAPRLRRQRHADRWQRLPPRDGRQLRPHQLCNHPPLRPCPCQCAARGLGVRLPPLHNCPLQLRGGARCRPVPLRPRRRRPPLPLPHLCGRLRAPGLPAPRLLPRPLHPPGPHGRRGPRSRHSRRRHLQYPGHQLRPRGHPCAGRLLERLGLGRVLERAHVHLLCLGLRSHCGPHDRGVHREPRRRRGPPPPRHNRGPEQPRLVRFRGPRLPRAAHHRHQRAGRRQGRHPGRPVRPPHGRLLRPRHAGRRGRHPLCRRHRARRPLRPRGGRQRLRPEPPLRGRQLPRHERPHAGHLHDHGRHGQGPPLGAHHRRPDHGHLPRRQHQLRRARRRPVLRRRSVLGPHVGRRGGLHRRLQLRARRLAPRLCHLRPGRARLCRRRLHHPDAAHAPPLPHERGCWRRPPLDRHRGWPGELHPDDRLWSSHHSLRRGRGRGRCEHRWRRRRRPHGHVFCHQRLPRVRHLRPGRLRVHRHGLRRHHQPHADHVPHSPGHGPQAPLDRHCPRADVCAQQPDDLLRRPCHPLHRARGREDGRRHHGRPAGQRLRACRRRLSLRHPRQRPRRGGALVRRPRCALGCGPPWRPRPPRRHRVDRGPRPALRDVPRCRLARQPHY